AARLTYTTLFRSPPDGTVHLERRVRRTGRRAVPRSSRARRPGQHREVGRGGQRRGIGCGTTPLAETAGAAVPPRGGDRDARGQRPVRTGERRRVRLPGRGR